MTCSLVQWWWCSGDWSKWKLTVCLWIELNNFFLFSFSFFFSLSPVLKLIMKWARAKFRSSRWTVATCGETTTKKQQIARKKTNKLLVAQTHCLSSSSCSSTCCCCCCCSFVKLVRVRETNNLCLCVESIEVKREKKEREREKIMRKLKSSTQLESEIWRQAASEMLVAPTNKTLFQRKFLLLRKV